MKRNYRQLFFFWPQGSQRDADRTRDSHRPRARGRPAPRQGPARLGRQGSASSSSPLRFINRCVIDDFLSVDCPRNGRLACHCHCEPSRSSFSEEFKILKFFCSYGLSFNTSHYSLQFPLKYDTIERFHCYNRDC